MKQYKISLSRTASSRASFDPQKLENALNPYAAEGWVVVTSATAEIPGLGRNREELITVLERDAA